MPQGWDDPAYEGDICAADYCLYVFDDTMYPANDSRRKYERRTPAGGKMTEANGMSIGEPRSGSDVESVPPASSEGDRSSGGTGAMPGGRRRIDRVLDEDFAAHLEELPMEELRGRRRDAEQEETDLSYLRRLIQGRVDIVQAEIERRGGAGGKGLVEQLTGILSAEGTTHQSPHGMGRYTTVEPSRLDERRRRVEKVVADVGISDAKARSDEELQTAISRLRELEAEVSRDRRLVQKVMDACTAEIGRRYREGTAKVDDLLHTRS